MLCGACSGERCAPRLRRADALVAVCDYEAEHFSRALGLAPDTIKRIANGADPLPVAGTAAR